MQKRNSRIRTYRMILFAILFILMLTSGRLFWEKVVSKTVEVDVQHGELSIAEVTDVISLTGEWEFYPGVFLMQEHNRNIIDEAEKKEVNVPRCWNDALYEDEESPYGFGTYRLQIMVEKNKEEQYAIYFPSIRSASEVYVNGEFVGGFGKVGTSEQDYIPKNLPLMTSFKPDERGVIDVIVHVANFKDNRASGIIRTPRFGFESTLQKTRNLSVLLQIIAATIYLFHFIYASVLYFIGERSRSLLAFATVLITLVLLNIISNDDKIFPYLLNLSYVWEFRIANILGVILIFALLYCFDHSYIKHWSKWSKVLSTIYMLTIITYLFSSPAFILKSSVPLGIVAFITLGLTFFTIIRMIYQQVTQNFILLLSIIAIFHHFSWYLYWSSTGVSVLHYPFDLLVAIICFSILWFRSYTNMYVETKELAVELQRLNKQKDQFLANTSHEFKNPLNGIINLTQSVLLRDKRYLNEKSIRELETILQTGKRMDVLLNDLLDSESLREGSPRIQKENVNVHAILTPVIDMLQVIVEVKPVRIENEIPQQFPNVRADTNRLTQIFYNLLHNAIKYTDEEVIRIVAKEEKDMAIIYIEDTGVGIDEKLLSNVFQPYEQGDNGRIKSGGLGLGLYITRQLIELHGGEIKLSSFANKGTVVTFSLPIAQANDGLESGNGVTTPVQSSHIEKLPQQVEEYRDEMLRVEKNKNHPVKTERRLPILVVDDDPINLQVLHSLLESEHYDITTVLSGEDALEVLEEKDWHLLIIDVMMPSMSGIELTERIRKRYSFTELPILLLTARSDPRDIQAGFLAGANDYVTKPIEMLELKARVKVLTTVRKALKEQLVYEAAWLQAQIQPHFLFNTMNSIIALSEIDIEKMKQLLKELSDYLRSKFRFNKVDELVPLWEELQLVRSYLNIEQVRFGDRLTVNWEINAERDVRIPFLSIQPLVENAVRHGIMQRVEGGTLTIRIEDIHPDVMITVKDDGVGMNESDIRNALENIHSSEEGVGLANTNRRIMRHFGTGLTIMSKEGEGTSVSFVVRAQHE